MKLKNLFFAALAVLGAAVACKQEETVPAGISVDVLKIEAPVDGTTVKVQVTSSEEWIALVGDKAKDWLHVLPASGPKGTSTITITVDELEGKDRKAVVSVATKMLPYAPAIISVTQKGTVSSGDGKTPETAFSASEAYAWVMENIKENNAPSDEKFYVKGYIHKIGVYKEVEQYFTGNTYGNATFYISDSETFDSSTEKDFEAYQVNYLGNRKFDASKDTDIKIGDAVIIYGYLTKYNSTAETMQQNTGKGAYIYSLNGKVEEAKPEPEETKAEPAGEGTEASPYNVSKAIDLAKALTYTSSSDYQKIEGAFIKGKIAKIDDVTDADLAQYGNRTYYIADEGYTAQFYVYRGLNLGNTKFTAKDQIKVGDEVVITGTLMNFKGNSPQLAQGNYLVELNGEKAGDTPAEPEVEPAGTGTEADPFNIAAAIAKAVETGTTATEQEYYIKGVVNADATPDSQYKNVTLDLVDEGSTKVFKAFRIYSFDCVQFLGTEQFKKGDVVVVLGKIVNHNSNTPETYASGDYRGTLISVNGEASFGPSFGVASKEISVGATATEAVVSVLSNVVWTAASTATIDKAAGEGSADIKVTFPANTDTENTKSHTVTLTTTADVPEKEIVVTITQGKAAAAGSVEVTMDKATLAAAVAGGAKVDMDAVISFTNSSTYSSSVTELRVYKSQTLTVTAASGYKISQIEFTCTKSGTEQYGPGCFGEVSPEGYTYSGTVGTWSGSAQSVSFKATSNQVRIIALKVTYVAD